jgi:hypothetical protein
MTAPPLHHIVRIRSSDDLTYVSQGLMDEILINANQLENSIQATTSALYKTTLPFSVDPVLWRFQVPAWSQKVKGETKRNYRRLGAAYAKGLGVPLGIAPLLETLTSDDHWRLVAKNIVAYQRDRLSNAPTQLELLVDLRELHPARLTAPALVAFSEDEDRINRLMTDAALEAAPDGVAHQLIIPIARLIDHTAMTKLIASIPSDGITSYSIWTPQVSEERLIGDPVVLTSLIRTIGELSSRGVAVGHQYANYSVMALRAAGVGSVTHHLGWVDKGEPAADPGFALRSCKTYAAGVRYSITFNEAETLARELESEEYLDRYCNCTFCHGMFENGEHPFDLLHESTVVEFRNGQQRHTPTARSVGANTWHFLLNRRQEVDAFSTLAPLEVIRQDIERSAALRRSADVARLEQLVTKLKSA